MIVMSSNFHFMRLPRFWANQNNIKDVEANNADAANKEAVAVAHAWEKKATNLGHL